MEIIYRDCIDASEKVEVDNMQRDQVEAVREMEARSTRNDTPTAVGEGEVSRWLFFARQLLRYRVRWMGVSGGKRHAHRRDVDARHDQPASPAIRQDPAS